MTRSGPAKPLMACVAFHTGKRDEVHRQSSHGGPRIRGSSIGDFDLFSQSPRDLVSERERAYHPDREPSLASDLSTRQVCGSHEIAYRSLANYLTKSQSTMLRINVE